MDVTQNPLIHLTLFIGSFVAILICLLLLTRRGNKKGYIIAPLTFFLDLFVFNIAIYLRAYYGINILTPESLFDWSSIIRLHAFIIILASVLVEPARSRYEYEINKRVEKIINDIDVK